MDESKSRVVSFKDLVRCESGTLSDNLEEEIQDLEERAEKASERASKLWRCAKLLEASKAELSKLSFEVTQQADKLEEQKEEIASLGKQVSRLQEERKGTKSALDRISRQVSTKPRELTGNHVVSAQHRARRDSFDLACGDDGSVDCSKPFKFTVPGDKDMRIEVEEYKSRVRIDVREWYGDKTSLFGQGVKMSLPAARRLLKVLPCAIRQAAQIERGEEEEEDDWLEELDKLRRRLLEN